jgi:hypothetical protein
MTSISVPRAALAAKEVNGGMIEMILMLRKGLDVRRE